MLPKVLKYVTGEGIDGIIKMYDTDYENLSIIDNNKLYVLRERSTTYLVEDAVGTNNYGFKLNTNDYYESGNARINSSYSLAKIIFETTEQVTITIQYIYYAQSSDYAYFSKIDTDFAASSSTETTTTYQKRCSSNSSVQTITYTIPEGRHYIMAKYMKDASTYSYNDSLQFKVILPE